VRRCIARGRLVVARSTDTHLPAPWRRLHQERWRIQTAFAEMTHEGRVDAGGPRSPLGHALLEGGAQRRMEGRYRRGRTPVRGGAGGARWGEPRSPWILACPPVLSPALWTVSVSPHPLASLACVAPTPLIVAAIIA
jgi:hypothetical protein